LQIVVDFYYIGVIDLSISFCGIFSLFVRERCSDRPTLREELFEIPASVLTLEHLGCERVDLGTELSMVPTDMAVDMEIDTARTDTSDLERLFIGLVLTVMADIVGEDCFEDVLEEYILHNSIIENGWIVG
jgi:hypothetical protein